MKVVHVVLGKANPRRMNGVNAVVHSLAVAQRRAGLDVEVWGLTRSLELDGGPREYHLRLFRRSRIPGLPALLRAALDALDSRDLLHFHGGWVPDFYPISSWLSRHGRRYVLTPHGAYNRLAMRKNAFLKRFYGALFERRLVRGAAAVHCVGRSEMDGLERAFGPCPRFLLPNGFPGELCQARGIQPSGMPRPVFGYCGRLDIAAKGLDALVDGFHTYKGRGGSGSLWIVGDGPDRAALRKRVEGGAGRESVVFWGERHGEDKEALLSALDVFVYPSRYEGFPVSVLEAAGLGRCLLVSEETNAGDYVERYAGGVVLRELSAAALTAVFFRLEQARLVGECAAMGEGARRIVLEELNWDRISREMAWRYRGLVAATTREGGALAVDGVSKP